MSDETKAPEMDPESLALIESLQDTVGKAVDQGMSHDRIVELFEAMTEQLRSERDLVNLDWKIG
jgi:hypothetical protein